MIVSLTELQNVKDLSRKCLLGFADNVIVSLKELQNVRRVAKCQVLKFKRIDIMQVCGVTGKKSKDFSGNGRWWVEKYDPPQQPPKEISHRY